MRTSGAMDGALAAALFGEKCNFFARTKVLGIDGVMWGVATETNERTRTNQILRFDAGEHLSQHHGDL